MFGFIHQPFFIKPFSTAIEVVSIFLPRKNGDQNAHHTLSHWLVALLLRHDSLRKRILCHIARSNDDNWFLTLYCKKCWWVYFICRIAQNNGNNSILSQEATKAIIARTQATGRHCNMQTVDCKKGRQWQVSFLCYIATTTTTFLHWSQESKRRQVVIN